MRLFKEKTFNFFFKVFYYLSFKVGPHEGSCLRNMTREHVAATNSRSVHTRRHVAETCSNQLNFMGQFLG